MLYRQHLIENYAKEKLKILIDSRTGSGDFISIKKALSGLFK